MKAAILRETLERAGLTALPEMQVHTGEPWAYRNRIRLRVAELEGNSEGWIQQARFKRISCDPRVSNRGSSAVASGRGLLQVAAEDSTAGALASRRGRGRVLHHG